MQIKQENTEGMSVFLLTILGFQFLYVVSVFKNDQLASLKLSKQCNSKYLG